MSRRQLIVYGPTPPPYGGVRVSFEMLYRHLVADDDLDVHLVDVPVRSSTTGRVSNSRTLVEILRSLPRLRKVDRVLVAGSRNFGFGYGGLIAVFSRLAGVPSSIRFYGGRPYQGIARFPKPLRQLALEIVGLHDHVSVETDVGCSEFPTPLRERIAVHYGHRYLPSGVMEHRGASSVVRFVYVGQVSAAKGTDLLLTAADQLASETKEAFELHLFGQAVGDVDLPDKAWLYSHGAVPNDQLTRQLRGFDVMVFPTVAKSEGHPGALIEAMLSGLPVVATDLPTIREIVTDGRAGILVPMGDSQALGRAMSKMLETDVRHKLSSGAYAESAKIDAASVLPSLAKSLGVYQ